MNRNLSTLLLSLLSVTWLASCGQDRWPEYAEQTHLDRWIDSVMRENYLWYASMPSDKELNYFIAPDQFLKSVTDQQDNGYTHIDTLMAIPEPTYGFDYTLYRNAQTDTLYEALITYVLPDSPAERAGLQRGQWIVAVNDSNITKKNEASLLASGKALKLTRGRYELQQTEDGKQTGLVTPTDQVMLEAAAAVEDNPINYYSILETANGKTGYLVYSHFTAGTEQEPEKYNNRLREIFQEFSAAGIQHLILDLRYNEGGSLAVAQLLASLAASGSQLGSPFATLEYNDKQTGRNRTLNLDRTLTGNMTPLDIRQGVIIAGSKTGGVCGTLLNCLAPQNKWALTGSEVSCPGVATETYIYPLRTWSLNLVTCTVRNQTGETGANGKFTPNTPCSETDDLTRFRAFGDPEETMLATAVSLIDGTYQPEAAPAGRQPEPVKEVKASYSRQQRRTGVRL